MPLWDLPGGPVVENPPANAEDMGLISGQGRGHKPRGNSARLPQLLSPSSRAQALKQEKPRQVEKAHVHQPRPSAARNK